MEEPRLPGNPVFDGDEVVASRWRRRWRAARRRVQLAFLFGVVGIPVAFRAAGSDDYWGPVGAFAVLVAAFSVAHLWAGARMWMRPARATDEGMVATRVARFVAPRRFARWSEVEAVTVEPWSSYGDRMVLKLRGGGTVHTIPGELDAGQVDAVRELVRRARPSQAPEEDPHAHP